jgi:hypothetical protein
MNLTEGHMALSLRMKELRHLWEETKEGWKDPVSQSFEENEWAMLETRVVGALRAIDRLAPILHKMKHECGPT